MTYSSSKFALTIAIPTFNRKSHVEKLIHQINANKVNEIAEVLVIDDGSNDQTFETLIKYADKKAIRIMRNESNLGYPHTFVRLFKECRTEYILVMADDDFLVIESLKPLIEFITSENPPFVSPQFLHKGLIYRGQTEKRYINPKEFWKCSSHAPGLVYNVTISRDYLDMLTNRITEQKEDALVYPQIVLVISLLSVKAKSYWFPLPVAATGAEESSGIRGSDGSAYWSFESRWRQLKAFEELLVHSADGGRAVKEILDTLRGMTFDRIVGTMESESPELRKSFDSEAKKYYLKQFIRKFIPVRQLKKLVHIFSK